MKTDKKILIAFFLNLFFSVIEFIGGTLTGSIAIISDSIHDLGDSLSIGISYVLEKISKKGVDEKYTYGYLRYSVLGSVITTVVLLVGSILVIYNSILRLIHPVEVNYDGMMALAVVGVLINLAASFITTGEGSLNQRSVNLHMFEDVLGWIVVLIGAVAMKFTDMTFIDPLLSMGVAAFILVNAIKNFKDVLDVFLEKTPANVSVAEITEHVSEVEGVKGVHHVHIWSMDGFTNYATLHIVTDGNNHKIKEEVREELAEHGIAHVTIETEDVGEECGDMVCNPVMPENHGHNHGHGHSHGHGYSHGHHHGHSHKNEHHNEKEHEHISRKVN